VDCFTSISRSRAFLAPTGPRVPPLPPDRGARCPARRWPPFGSGPLAAVVTSCSRAPLGS
jgi:hypothetical protein